jgi:hypothetical protein
MASRALLLPEHLQGCAHEIEPGLWVGDANSAEIAIRDGFDVLNVLENPSTLPEDHIPILVPKVSDATFDGVRAYRSRLDDVAAWIENRRRRHVLVHCAAGIERSPLAVTWWITKTTPCTFVEAFWWVHAHRPVAENRFHWIEPASQASAFVKFQKPVQTVASEAAGEIEVTPEMIEAGVRVLWDSGTVENPNEDMDRNVIQKIFVAMIGHT